MLDARCRSIVQQCVRDCLNDSPFELHDHRAARPADRSYLHLHPRLRPHPGMLQQSRRASQPRKAHVGRPATLHRHDRARELMRTRA